MHKFSDKVPEPTLRRLPWYLSNVKLMKEQGETYVSSTQISKQINVDASQIAKDLSYVNISGRTRVGYEIDALIEVLERFLGFTKMHKAFLFVLFVWRGIVIAIKAEDNFGTLIAIGITTMIGLQALINIAVVTNTMPVTGMPLPFFSYGGSAMLADLIGVGILLSVSRNGKTSS